MRKLTIAEVKALDDEELVPCIQGEVTAIYNRKEGESSKGPWSFQDLTLKDETAGEIKVTLNNRIALAKTAKGKTLMFTCSKGDHGLTGVKAKDNEYNGKTTRLLWVTPSAEIDFVDGGSDNNNSEGPEPPSYSEADEEHGQPTPAPKTNGNGNGHKRCEGVTIGMSINNAINIIRDLKPDEDFYNSPGFSQKLHQIASDIARVSEYLQAGKLAPSSREREAAAKAALVPQPHQGVPPPDLGWPDEEPGPENEL